jgi:cation:H+ antiporter
LALNSLLILAGFALLAKGADILVDGACAIARKYRFSELVIGLTVVALGTSAPELVVCVISSLKGTDGITVGNVVGSNVANLCLVLGIAGLMTPVVLRRGTVWKEIPFCVGTSVLLLAIMFFGDPASLISRGEGLLLLGTFAVYLVFMFATAGESPQTAPHERLMAGGRAAAMVGGGLAALMAGGELIVRNCESIALRFGLSEGVVGVTIVAIGTSLPELATSAASIRKGKPDIAVGNIVGSNILNTCLVLGVSAAIQPIASMGSFTMDAAVIVAASIALFFFMFTGEKLKVDRWEALLFLATYAGYIAFAVYRG